MNISTNKQIMFLHHLAQRIFIYQSPSVHKLPNGTNSLTVTHTQELFQTAEGQYQLY